MVCSQSGNMGPLGGTDDDRRAGDQAWKFSAVAGVADSCDKKAGVSRALDISAH